MTTEYFASMLNGREYGKEITRAEIAQAKELGLVIVYGYSDDNVEFDGAFRDEVSCYEGTIVHVSKNGVFEPKKYCPRHDGDVLHNECEFIKQKQALCKTIKAVWCGEDDYSWTYETEIPHATFDILEDGEKFCRGIVFDVNNL